MFQFSAFASRPKAGMPCLQHGGLPHSEIRGSNRMCRYPRLIAACHVLPRLREPRHPPCALIYFLYGNAPLLLSACLPVCRNATEGTTEHRCPIFGSSLSQYVKELFFGAWRQG